jgi:hypothetical protein
MSHWILYRSYSKGVSGNIQLQVHYVQLTALSETEKMFTTKESYIIDVIAILHEIQLLRC